MRFLLVFVSALVATATCDPFADLEDLHYARPELRAAALEAALARRDYALYNRSPEPTDRPKISRPMPLQPKPKPPQPVNSGPRRNSFMDSEPGLAGAPGPSGQQPPPANNNNKPSKGPGGLQGLLSKFKSPPPPPTPEFRDPNPLPARPRPQPFVVRPRPQPIRGNSVGSLAPGPKLGVANPDPPSPTRRSLDLEFERRGWGEAFDFERRGWGGDFELEARGWGDDFELEARGWEGEWDFEV